jgi:hypothetical protein
VTGAGRVLDLKEGEMRFRSVLIGSLFAIALLLTTGGVYYVSAANAQDPPKETTTQSTGGTKTETPTGFPTGTKCTKTGTYTAENKYLKVVIVVADGEEFPPFTDGEKTIWYALAPSTKSTFEAVKVTTDPK